MQFYHLLLENVMSKLPPQADVEYFQILNKVVFFSRDLDENVAIDLPEVSLQS